MDTAFAEVAVGRPRRVGPDARALAVASALQARLADAQVLLFGSRATGSWRPRSDIDLAVIGVEDNTAADIRNQARSYSQVVYGEAAPAVQIFTFTQAEFVRCRTSLPHLAGQVQRFGRTPAGEHLPPRAQDNPWPQIQVLLQAGVRNLAKALYALVTAGSYDSPVFFAQGALETVIKARLLALRIPFDRDHDMVALVALLPRAQRWLVDSFTSSELAQMRGANLEHANLFEVRLDHTDLAEVCLDDTFLDSTTQLALRDIGESAPPGTYLSTGPASAGAADRLAAVAGPQSRQLADHAWPFTTAGRGRMLFMAEFQSTSDPVLALRQVAYALLQVLDGFDARTFTLDAGLPEPLLLSLYTGLRPWTPPSLAPLFGRERTYAFPLGLIYLSTQTQTYPVHGSVRFLTETPLAVQSPLSRGPQGGHTAPEC